MAKTAEQRVDEAAALLADFEAKIHQIDEQRQHLFLQSIQEAEMRAVERVKALIDELEAKRAAQN